LRPIDELGQGSLIITYPYPEVENILSQKEVIPVDTHVHQIAVKHYGLRASGGAKANMTPKLYDEVNAKLGRVWGEYAGWAHSVSICSALTIYYLLLLTRCFSLPTSNPSLHMGFRHHHHLLRHCR
jgi:hypothetical protein